jgi:hypothetical protein
MGCDSSDPLSEADAAARPIHAPLTAAALSNDPARRRRSRGCKPIGATVSRRDLIQSP